MKKFTYRIVCALMIQLLLPLFTLAKGNADFAELIKQAIAAGQKKINIPKGSYYMEMKNGEPLILEGLKGIEINANGSEVVTRLASLAIDIRNCENIKLKGFSIDCETLPFTQGKIVAISPDRMWWDLEIMGGYPLGNIDNRMPDRVQIFDPQTQNLRKNLYTYFRKVFSKIEKVGDRTFRFSKAKTNPDANEILGDYVVMTLDVPDTRPHTIVVSKSKKIQMEDVIIYSGNCFGFFEDQCESNVYNRCQVTKKTNDPKLAFPRLRSINADAFHSKGATIGPTVTNCVFMYHGDDCIAINTSFYKVISSTEKQVDIAARSNAIKMKVGNTLRFVDFEGNVVGEAKVINIDATTEFSKTEMDKVNELFKATKDNRAQTNATRLTLDRKINVSAGAVVSSLDMGGSGFVVKSNVMGYTRARGILVKSSDGVISGNTIIGCELGGIVLAPELFWMEAGFSRNVLVENNIVRDCMFANSSYGIEQAAPISVIAINTKGVIVPSGGFKNIRIINNKIENSPIPAMIITSVDGAVIKGNNIKISKDIIRTHGSKFGVDNKKVIWTKNTANLTINDKDNAIDNLAAIKH